jgi:hypothetical protein
VVSLNKRLRTKLKRRNLFAAIAILAVASGCGGGVTNPVYQLNVGGLIADFPNGSGFTSSVGQGGIQANLYAVSATQNVGGLPADEITLYAPIDANVPYTVTGSGGAEVRYYDALTGKTYDANGAQGNCQITITQTSPTLMGTFSAKAIFADSSVVLNNGQFNVSLN